MKPFALLASLALLQASPAVGMELYHGKPLDAEGADRNPAYIRNGDGPITIQLHIDTGGSAAASAPCSGGGTAGNDVCAWDIDCTATGGIEIMTLTPQAGKPADYIVQNLANPASLSFNGGDPFVGELGVQVPIATLEVVATGDSGSIQCTGDAVEADLTKTTVPMSTVAIACPANDRDCDTRLDSVDLCPFYQESDPLADADGNGIGDECTCGDAALDGILNINDVFQSNALLGTPANVTPLSDANGDDVHNINDIFATNAALGGAPTFCARYPSAI